MKAGTVLDRERVGQEKRIRFDWEAVSDLG